MFHDATSSVVAPPLPGTVTALLRVSTSSSDGSSQDATNRTTAAAANCLKQIVRVMSISTCEGGIARRDGSDVGVIAALTGAQQLRVRVSRLDEQCVSDRLGGLGRENYHAPARAR